MITAGKTLFLSALLGLGLSAGAVVAQDGDRPLLREGRETVYQRVLTRPGATLLDARDGEELRVYPAFQPLYVFAAEPGWVQVGPSVSAPPEGWVTEDSVVEWKQNIVAAFTNPAGRERQILFESEDRLRDLMEHEALREMQGQILQEIETGEVPDERGVVAAEPPVYVNIVD